jgi:radical SAM protein with 4Fe4S-binding SPASM domain
MELQKNNRSAGLSSPERVSLNITKKCNLRCRHCFSDGGEADANELTTPEIFNLLDQMKNTGSFHVAIGGGEPLLRKDLFQIIEYAKKKSIAVSIVTNGTLINKKVAQKLNASNLDTITVSLDGLEKNHDYIRGKGNFQKTINGIKILKKYCQTPKLALRVIINKLNVGECRALVKLAENFSFDLIRFTPMLLSGRAKDNRDLLITQGEYIHFLQKGKEIQSKSGVEVILPGARSGPEWLICPENFGCHCGKQICWINQTGDFYPCIFFGEEFKAGNIRNEKFLDLWNRAKNMVKLKGNNICNNCPAYKKCRGGCRARALWEHKDINAIDPLCPLGKNNNLLNL